MDKDFEKVIDDKFNEVEYSIEDLYVPVNENITNMVNEQNKKVDNDRKLELINEILKHTNMGITMNSDDFNNSIFEDMSVEELEEKLEALKKSE